MQLICEFIRQQREAKNITLENLSSGLCHFSYLANKIEKKGNVADKFLIDALLQRLGISDDYFEHFVSVDDINIQNIRLDIFENIKSNNYTTIENLLLKYGELNLNNMHKQFIEYIKAVVLYKQSAPTEDVLNQYLKSIKLTLINFNGTNISEMLLSSVEACIVFEYAELIEQNDTQEGMQLYLQLYRYFNKKDIETGIKCRILPKLIYNICKIWLNEDKNKAVISLCNNGIECLCDNYKLYYFTKLLELKINAIEISKLNHDELDEMKKRYVALTEFYVDYDVDPNDSNTIYLQNFLWQNYDAIGDVIKNRRKMFKMSQAKLAEGICDIKTLSRIENGQVKPHVQKTELILKSLNLSGQFYADSIIYEDYESFVLARELNISLAKNDNALAKEKLELLKQKLNLSEKTNLQYIRLKETIISRNQNEFTLGETLSKLISTLEITLPNNTLRSSNELYLTKTEIILLNIIANSYDTKKNFTEKSHILNTIENHFNENKLNFVHYSGYFFSYLNLSSNYGNENNFDKSNYLLLKLLRNSFKLNYYSEFINIVYDLTWDFYTQNNFSFSCNNEYTKLYEILKTLANIQNNDCIKNLIKKNFDK